MNDTDYVIITISSNYDEKTNLFNTYSVEAVIAKFIQYKPKAFLAMESTIPVGFIDYEKDRLDTYAINFFS